MSVGIEFGTALMYPADEAAVYGILDSTAELSGFLLVVALGGAMSRVNMNIPSIGIVVCLVGVALVLLWRLKGKSKRPSSLS